MKTIYQRMEELLRAQPEARERKNKARAVRHFLMKSYPELAQIPMHRLMDAITEAESYNRAWRKVTEENEELRGRDYDKKARLVVQKWEELGYHITTK